MKAKESLPVLLECYCFGRRSMNTLLAGKLEFLLLPLLSCPLLLLLLSVVCLLSASVFYFRNEGTKMMMMPVLPDGFGSGSFFFSAIFPFSCLLVAASGSGFFLGSVCAFFPPLLLGSFSGFLSQNPPWFRLLLSSSVPKILLCSGSFFVSSPVVFLLPVFFPLLFSLPVLFVFPLLRFVRCPPVFVCLLLWFSGPWVFLLPPFLFPLLLTAF